MKVNGREARELCKDATGALVIEPYCGECAIDFWSGKTWCTCGYTLEQRRDSGWMLSGARPVNGT
jgi:hypothetical protein